MSAPTSYRLNLVIDEKMQEILAYFRARYPLLKDIDLIKMAVSGFYSSGLGELPVHKLTPNEEESLIKSITSNKTANPAFSKVEDLVSYLDN
jgi:hypothetical protein